MATRAVRAGLLSGILVAAVLVPAASAGQTTQVKLTLVPLPKSALGPAGSALPLTRDSGVVTNAKAASHASADVTAGRLKRMGRVSGYLLDYGNPFASGTGIRQIETEVDWYRSARDARKALDFWRRDEVNVALLRKMGLIVSFNRLRPSGIPGPHWVYASTGSIKGLEPIHAVDAEFQYGRFLLDVSVAGSTSAAARIVPTLARKLYQRIRRVLAGHLRTAEVKLPPPLKPGPPAHGPKPASLMLMPADVGSSATVVRKGYSNPESSLDEIALSVYDQTLTSSGQFRFVTQEVLVGGNQLEAQYFGAIAVGAFAAAFGKVAKVTPLDLSGVGDNARGELVQLKVSGGQSAYEAIFAVTHGSYLDFVGAVSAAPITVADVSSLARRTAKRLDAGF